MQELGFHKPEQDIDEAIFWSPDTYDDITSDIWILGAIIIHSVKPYKDFLTGEFEGYQYISNLDLKNHVRNIFFSSHPIDSTLKELVFKMLDSNPKTRIKLTEI